MRMDYVGLYAALIIISIVVIVPGIIAQTSDTIISRMTLANSIPIASSVSVDGGATDITLTAGTTTIVNCTATITDNNGCTNISSVAGVLYKTSVGSTGADDENYRYTNSSCVVQSGTCTGDNDTSSDYACTFSVEYYADPTDTSGPSGNIADNWTCKVTPNDGETGTFGIDSNGIEMDALSALSVNESEINFGAMQLGSNTGSVNQNTTVINEGNINIDIQLSGYGLTSNDGACMICTQGNISVEKMEYYSTAFAYGNGINLTNGGATLNMDISQRVNDESYKVVRWGIGIESSGINGNCSGIINFLVVSDPDSE